MIDSIEEVHSETLINKRRRREVATAIHDNKPHDNEKVIENEE
jgi:hypothetical protein